MPTGLGTNRSHLEKLVMRLSWVPWWATSRSLPIVASLLSTELRKGYGIHLGRSGRAAAAGAYGMPKLEAKPDRLVFQVQLSTDRVCQAGDADAEWRVLVGAEETGQGTGTKDKDYNLIWFVEQCLSNALRLETYIQDAEREGDSELADFFRRAQGESRKGAEQGKQLLRSRIA
jgi:hypothetical protein